MRQSLSICIEAVSVVNYVLHITSATLHHQGAPERVATPCTTGAFLARSLLLAALRGRLSCCFGLTQLVFRRHPCFFSCFGIGPTRVQVRREVDLMRSKHNTVPGLAVIMVGERRDSAKYVSMKQVRAQSSAEGKQPDCHTLPRERQQALRI